MLAILFGAGLVLLAATSHFVAGLAAILIVGALSSGFQSLNNSLTLSMSESEYYGRVQSISMLSWSLFGLVALPIGIVADAIGIRETLALQGLVVMVSVSALQFWRRGSAAEDRERAVLAETARRAERVPTEARAPAGHFPGR